MVVATDPGEFQGQLILLGEAPPELGLKGREQSFLAVVRGDSVYRGLFQEAFPGEQDAYTLQNITKAIAAFERSIVSMRSAYDRYRWGGDSTAISDAAKRGEGRRQRGVKRFGLRGKQSDQYAMGC